MYFTEMEEKKQISVAEPSGFSRLGHKEEKVRTSSGSVQRLHVANISHKEQKVSMFKWWNSRCH